MVSSPHLQTMRNRPPSGTKTLQSSPSIHGAETPPISLTNSSFSSSLSPPTTPIPNPGQNTTTTTKHHTTSRAHKLFCDLILPLADDDVYPHLPEKTAFIFTEEDILSSTLQRIDKKCPQLFKDREKFLKTVEQIVFGSVMVVQ
jgi:hypothetical protein